MADANAINNLSRDLTIRPSSAGDMFIQFNLGGTDKFIIGVDDSDSDSFKISQGGALGTNDTFIVTAAGEITQPLQSATSARRVTTVSNVTGDGTEYTLVGFTSIYDQNSDFNESTGTFNAPLTARYLFNLTIRGGAISSASFTSGLCKVTTSNRTYFCNFINPGAMADPTFGQYQFHGNVLVDMDASDTATVSFIVSGSTKTVNLLGAAGSVGVNYVMVTLIC